MSERIQCVLCQTTLPDIQKAIDAEWIPEFWETSDDDPEGVPHGPCCSTCCRVYLEEDPIDHELVTRRFIGV